MKHGRGNNTRRTEGMEQEIEVISIHRVSGPFQLFGRSCTYTVRSLASTSKYSAIRTISTDKHTHAHTHTFNGSFWGLPIWILLKQETVSGSGISWATCQSAPRSRQITTPASHHSVFYRPDALPAAQPTASKHWRN